MFGTAYVANLLRLKAYAAWKYRSLFNIKTNMCEAKLSVNPNMQLI